LQLTSSLPPITNHRSPIPASTSRIKYDVKSYAPPQEQVTIIPQSRNSRISGVSQSQIQNNESESKQQLTPQTFRSENLKASSRINNKLKDLTIQPYDPMYVSKMQYLRAQIYFIIVKLIEEGS
jgi:hypothetical protein